MASIWDDIFSEDTLNTIQNGINTVGSFFNAASPLINAGSQLGFGIEGTRNAAALRQASQKALDQLDQLFTTESPYAKEARRQMERKDAAAGRRSQYGTRETELAANLTKQRLATLTSPAYQALLVGANRSDYAPIAGAIGNLTGGLGGQGGQAVDAQGRPINRATGSNSMVPGASSFAQYLGNLFGPGAEASIASLGGAGSALGGSGLMGGMGGAGVGAGAASMGVPDALGSMLGGNPFLPTFGTGAEGIFGSGVMAPSTGGGVTGTGGAGGATGGGNAGDLTGVIGGLGDWLGGAGAFGGAGSALSGMGAGSLAGTVGGVDALGGILGGTGFLPSYGAAGGGAASGLFGGAGAAAGGEAAAGGAGAAAGGLGGLGGLAGFGAVAALPILGMLGAFDSDLEEMADLDLWRASAADPYGSSTRYNLSPNQGEDYSSFLSRAQQMSNAGNIKYDPAAEPYIRQYYDRQVADRGGVQNATPESWWDNLYNSYGGG